MTYTEKILEDKLRDMLSDAGLKSIDFQMNNSGVRIISLAEERERVVDKIATIRGYHLMRSSSTKEDVLNELFDLLSSLDKPDKE